MRKSFKKSYEEPRIKIKNGVMELLMLLILVYVLFVKSLKKTEAGRARSV